ncbi:HNH endonuclease family protein [Nocardia inohanensis]|uniref:HNH endonuclease family protein n=1 Tax=Nocardia inohanensis TaxID=209246 RepID=UPI000834E1A7|nr:HNH endonuclease family protein [Nocardia inohanensis]
MLQKKPSSLTKIAGAIGSALFVIVLIVVAALLNKSGDSPKTNPGQTNPTVAGSATEIKALLGKLKVADELPMTGYSREQFPHWDTNKPEHGFGDAYAAYSKCTTREVMLLRDATGSVKLDPATCKFTVGKDGGWRDQYGVPDKKTNELKPYKFITDSSGVDIDHIVALAEAWRSGAAKMDEDTRRNIANDAVNLSPSDPTANRSKGDQDAANYLPPGNFRCGYVGRYLQVKVKYGLNVDSKEQAALKTAVQDCIDRGGFK